MSLVFITYLISIAYSLSRGTEKSNALLPLPITIDGQVLETSVVIDSNWRWIHEKNGYENCFNNGWVDRFCPDAATCSENCVIDGVPLEEYENPYGVSVDGNTLRLNYLTKGQYGTNVGSRMYIVAPDGVSYQGFDMTGKEISFMVDVSKVPCGLNGAVYFIEMPLTNSYDTDLDASYGINYGDAQCPKDIKYIHGDANLGNFGTCSNEYDIWEANAYANAYALHPCSFDQVYRCDNDIDCGVDEYRFEGVCDKNGASYNPNRVGILDEYGLGTEFKVDTNKPFKVITRFYANESIIHTVQRLYEQNGNLIEGGSLDQEAVLKQKEEFNEPDHFTELGGFETMTQSFERQHVLALSLWDDVAVNMRWLDSVYPVGSTDFGTYRGPCSNEDTRPETLRAKYPDAYVIYSDIVIKDIGSPTPSPSPSPSPSPTPSPSPSPTCSKIWSQCGGIGYDGPTCCEESCCVKDNDYYSQCKPCDSPSPTPSPPPSPNGYWKCDKCIYID